MTVAPEVILEHLLHQDELEACNRHPAFLLDHVKAIDAKTGERFEFQLLDPTSPWYWQREMLDWWLDSTLSIVLKARQLGATWLAAGLALWYLLYRPGSRVLAVSINEEEAAKIVNRVWDMYLSLPEHLKNGVSVLKPTRGARPHTTIEFQHTDGRVSTMIGLPSTPTAGHGETAALVLLDEFSRQKYARETAKAVLPTMSGGGRIAILSTGNGVSNDLTGEGNHFHHLWTHADEYGYEKRFLKWDLHPDRDAEWYRVFAMVLPSKDRAEQYPADEHEAFILTGDLYFDQDALADYSTRIPTPLKRGRFTSTTPRAAKFTEQDKGLIQVFAPPIPSTEYAIGVDVAQGRGIDYSCAFVIDLSDMTLAAELHGKIDADILAYQLHFLGRWYNTARIAVEVGGGYGEAPIAFLRDGKEGRPPYPKLYRHRQPSRPDFVEHKPFGYPMSSKTRPLVLEGLEKALRERDLPFVTHGLMAELQTFVHAQTTPSPRAQDGCNDDRVMACAIATEMYRQFGHHPERPRRTPKKPKPAYPWMEER